MPSHSSAEFMTYYSHFLQMLYDNLIYLRTYCQQHLNFALKELNFINDFPRWLLFFFYFTSKWILGAVCRCHNNKVPAGQFVCKWDWAWPHIYPRTWLPWECPIPHFTNFIIINITIIIVILGQRSSISLAEIPGDIITAVKKLGRSVRGEM